MPLLISGLQDLGYEGHEPKIEKLDSRSITSWLDESTRQNHHHDLPYRYSAASCDDDNPRRHERDRRLQDSESSVPDAPSSDRELPDFATPEANAFAYSLADGWLARFRGTGAGGSGDGNSPIESFGRHQQQPAAGEMAGSFAGTGNPFSTAAPIQSERTPKAGPPELESNSIQEVSRSSAPPMALVSESPGNAPSSANVRAAWANAVDVMGKTPIRFEKNEGQTDEAVDFTAKGLNYSLWLTSTQAVMAYARPAEQEASPLEEQLPAGRRTRLADLDPPEADVVRFQLVNSNADASAVASNELVTKSHYYVGNDPTKWRTNVANYGEVTYRDVWNGIDLKYYGTDQHQLEFDFIVHAGADVSQIRFDVAGAESVSVNERGELALGLSDGRTIIQHAPILYQSLDGRRQPITGQFTLDSDRVGFEVGDFDENADLVIDPVLEYSSYLGGAGPDSATDIRVDADGYIYIGGTSGSVGFPGSSSESGSQAYVAILNSHGYLTNFAVVGLNTTGNALDIDGQGGIYLTGEITTNDLPTTPGAWREHYDGGDGVSYVTRLSGFGSEISYSTYLSYDQGGDSFGGNNYPNAITVDSAGNAIVVGGTGTSLELENPFDDVPGAGKGFVTKLNSNGSALVFSSFIGGDDAATAAMDVDLDSSDNVYVYGFTAATNLDTTGGFQTTNDGVSNYLAKITPSGGLNIATYFGDGTQATAETEGEIAVDDEDNIYVVGSTSSDEFPVFNAQQPEPVATSQRDGYLAKFSSLSTTPVYSTYLGGPNPEGLDDVAVDSDGRPVVIGGANDDFPTVASMYGTGGNLVARYTADGQDLQFASRIQGSFYNITGMAIGPDDNIYIVGNYHYDPAPPDLPIVRPYQETPIDYGDVFVMIIGRPAPPVITALTFDTGASDSDRLTNDDRLIISGTADPFSEVQVFISSAGANSPSPIGSPVSVDENGEWALDYTATPLSEGIYDFFAKSTYDGQISDLSDRFQLNLDLTPPRLTIWAPGRARHVRSPHHLKRGKLVVASGHAVSSRTGPCRVEVKRLGAGAWA